MFDTKIYHNFGCDCLQCHRPDCHCNYHFGRTGAETLRQQILEESIYRRGYYDGQKATYEELNRKGKMFESCTDQQKCAEQIKSAMKPLEELLKSLT